MRIALNWDASQRDFILETNLVFILFSIYLLINNSRSYFFPQVFALNGLILDFLFAFVAFCRKFIINRLLAFSHDNFRLQSTVYCIVYIVCFSKLSLCVCVCARLRYILMYYKHLKCLVYRLNALGCILYQRVF